MGRGARGDYVPGGEHVSTPIRSPYYHGTRSEAEVGVQIAPWMKSISIVLVIMCLIALVFYAAFAPLQSRRTVCGRVQDVFWAGGWGWNWYATIQNETYYVPSATTLGTLRVAWNDGEPICVLIRASEIVDVWR